MGKLKNPTVKNEIFVVYILIKIYWGKTLPYHPYLENSHFAPFPLSLFSSLPF